MFDASILTGPVANFPVADSFNRRLERDYSTGDMPHVFVTSAIWDLPFGAGRGRGQTGVARRDGQRLDADRHPDHAVGHAAGDHPDDQQQRFRRLRHAAAQPGRGSAVAGRRAVGGAFNVTNTPPLGVPNTTVGAAVFGTITSAGDPRVVQLALKYVF